MPAAFSAELMQALAAAREEACRLGDGQIDVGHLFLAVLKLRNSRGRELLASLGVDPGALIPAFRGAQSDTSMPTPSINEIAPDGEARSLLASAAEEAGGLNHVETTTVHLLLGMARDSSRGVGAMLERAGASYARLRAGAGSGP